MSWKRFPYVAAVMAVLLFAIFAKGAQSHAQSRMATKPLTQDSIQSHPDSIAPVDSVSPTDSLAKAGGTVAPRIGSKAKITPVESDDKRPPSPTLHYYDKHGDPLEEPVLFLAELDTVKKAQSKPVYPLLNSVSVGANFFDAVMLAAGQKHASFDLWADLSLHNWFFPVLEAGVGFADNQPDDGNFHYKGKPSFYAKVGLNYNFLYKSNPDYQVFVGLRAGVSHFRYDITDITINSPYWDQSNRFSILDQRATTVFGEAVAGVKVKIVGNFSMGWSFRYKFKLHSGKGSESTPWFVPGYGTGNIGATFSLIWNIPLSRRKAEAEPDSTLPDAAPLPAPTLPDAKQLPRPAPSPEPNDTVPTE